MLNTWLEKTRLVRGLRSEIRMLFGQLDKARAELRAKTPRPARFRLEGGMTEETIEMHLAGTEHQPTVKAILARIGARVVRASDQATDEPRETVVVDGRTLPGYSEEMRLYDSGRTSAFAEMLADLQQLTAPRPEVAEKLTKAAG